MFTWICPKCGGEVPPSYSECPKCSPVQTAPPAAGEQPPAPQPQAPPTPPAAVPQVPRPPQPAPARGIPGWAVALLVFLALVGIAAGVFAYVGSQRNQAAAQAPAQKSSPEAQSFATPASLKAHPELKYLEMTGLRLTEDGKQKAYIQFVLVNHSGAEIPPLAGKVELKAGTGQEPIGIFRFQLPSLGPYEAKDMKESLATKLRVYELPDWQYLRPELDLTTR